MLEIQTTGSGHNYEPGEQVELEVRWDLEKAPERLELRVVCNTVGKGDTDLQLTEIWKLANPATRGRERLTITLPPAPYSYSGKLVSFVWGFELLAPPLKDTNRLEFVLAPRGEEIRPDQFAESIDS